MERNYIVDKKLEKVDFTQSAPDPGDYENCQFINCNFQSADISGLHFCECEFIGCNMSMAKLIKTAFKDVQFKNCKLLGLHFETCDPFLFSASFEDCSLKLTSFFKTKLPKTTFRNCGLEEVDFAEADLNHSIFDKCNLQGALFENTNLEHADLRTSEYYTINPESNKIRKAKFSLAGVAGLLGKYDIIIE
jgi:fluoroquinolone resistance protein